MFLVSYVVLNCIVVIDLMASVLDLVDQTLELMSLRCLKGHYWKGTKISIEIEPRLIGNVSLILIFYKLQLITKLILCLKSIFL